MNDLLQEAICETVLKDESSDVVSSAMLELADMQLVTVGGGIGNVLWG